MHGVAYLLYKRNLFGGLVMLGLHIGLLWVDPLMLSDVENAHPYLTGMSIVLGLTQWGLNGVIIGPLLVCLSSWAVKVIAFYCVGLTASHKMSSRRVSPAISKHASM